MGDLFSAGLNGKAVGNPKIDKYGTSVIREISLVFTAGERKRESAESLQINYFYKDGNMSATPEVASVIPIPDKKALIIIK